MDLGNTDKFDEILSLYCDPGRLEALSEEFFQQDEFICMKNFFPKEFVENYLTADAKHVHPLRHRSYIPLRKKGGSVSSYIIAEKAPSINKLYHSTVWMQFLRTLVKQDRFYECPAKDPHGAALYFYEEGGDHIEWHYDTSLYKGKLISPELANSVKVYDSRFLLA